jgi:hypothetical protein
MIRARLGLPAAAAVARRQRRRPRPSTSASTADARTAPSAGTWNPPLEPVLRAGRVARGRETQARRNAIPAAIARPLPSRAGCRFGDAGTRGRAAGLCPRSGSVALRSRELGTGTGSLPRPWVTFAGGSADSAERTPDGTGAGTAVATPVLTSGGFAASRGGDVDTAAAGATGATAGAGGAAGAGCPSASGGTSGACSAAGRKSSGSRYPFGSEVRRTPR